MTRARVRQTFSEWWHGLPWNGLFWLSVIALLGAATVFGVAAEVHLYRAIGVDEHALAEIRDGGTAKVVLILNGDEVVVQTDDGRRARARMLAIRSFDPVVNEREITTYGDASVRFLERWTLNKQVILIFDRTIRDPRGRYLAYLHLDEIDINRRMVEEGIAMVYTEFPTAREQAYLIAEQSARDARRGIWGGTKAVIRARALRRDWAGARAEREGRAPLDPFIEGATN